MNYCGIILYLLLIVSGQMVKLAKIGQANDGVGIGELELISSPQAEKWANAAEFVPGQVWRGSGMFVTDKKVKK